MKKKIILLVLGIVLVLSSCGKDEKTKLLEDTFKDGRGIVETTKTIEHKENIKFLKEEMDDFVNGKVKYKDYLNNDLDIIKVFEADEFEKVTLFNEEITVEDVNTYKLKDGTYVTNIEQKLTYSFRDSGKAVITLFSKEDPKINKNDKVNFTLLPYKTYWKEEKDYSGNDLKGQKGNLVVADYEVVK